MGIQAVYLAVSDNEVEKLQQLPTEKLLAALEEIQESHVNHINIGKIWDGLHFVLTKVSASTPMEDNELSEFVVGTYIVLEDEFVAFSATEDIERIFNKINELNFNDFKKDFNPKSLTQQNIYPNIWVQEDKEILFDELKTSFEELRTFYQKNIKQNIIVTIY